MPANVAKPINLALSSFRANERTVNQQISKLSSAARADPVAWDLRDSLTHTRTQIRADIAALVKMLEQQEEQGEQQCDPIEERVQMQVLKRTRDSLREIAESRNPTRSMVREIDVIVSLELLKLQRKDARDIGTVRPVRTPADKPRRS